MSRMFDRVFSRLLKRGTLEVTYASGEKAVYGEPADGFPDVAVRFTDDKVPRDIVLDPRLGAGEAYMDGRIVIERGGVMELVQLVQAAHADGNDVDRDVLDVFLALGRGDDDLGLIGNIAFLRDLHRLRR